MHNVAKIYNRSGHLLGTLHYSTPSAAEYIPATLNIQRRGRVPLHYIGKLYVFLFFPTCDMCWQLEEPSPKSQV